MGSFVACFVGHDEGLILGAAEGVLDGNKNEDGAMDGKLLG